MTIAAVFADAFGRIRETVHDVVDDLSPDHLGFRAGGHANSIAWLVWHLTRIQDDHVAKAAGTVQIWTSGGWCERFALPFDAEATGYGQTAHEVGSVQVAAGLLTDYHDAVCENTLRYVASLTDGDLDRIVDARWDPPVTLGVRLVSVITDDLQHAGQAAFIRGLVERSSRD